MIEHKNLATNTIRNCLEGKKFFKNFAQLNNLFTFSYQFVQLNPRTISKQTSTLPNVRKE